MDNQSTPTTFSVQPLSQNRKTNNVLPIVVLIIVVAISVLIFFRGKNKNVKTSSVANVTPTQEATPAPTVAVDKKTVKIQVLNGTGTPGQAASAVKALETAGYSADNIKTDNATKYDQTQTTITAKSGFSGTADDIKTALASTFDNITIDSSQLGSDSQYDIIITTGGKIYQTPTPKPTNTPVVTPTSSPNATNTPTPTSTTTPTPTP